MKKKITALLCSAALLVNMTVLAAEDIMPAPADIAELPAAAEEFYSELNENEITDLEEKENEDNASNEKDEENQEQDAPEIEIENNEDLDIFANDEVHVLSAEEEKEALKELIDEVKNCNPDDVADEESMAELRLALSEAEAAYADGGADKAAISKAAERLTAAVKHMKYLSGESILTNNAFSAEHKEKYYPELAGENPALTFLETSASYKYEEGSPIAAFDSGKRLTDGLASGPMTTDTNVKTASSVVFDLGAEYYISGADVFSQFFYLGAAASLHRNIKGFEAEVSTDGTNFKKVSHAAAKTVPDEGEGNGRYDLKTSACFAAALARYVRITILCDDNSTRYTLNEVVIKGFKSPFSRDELYEALVKYAGVDSFVHTSQSYSAYISAYKNAEKIYWDENASGRVIFDAKTELEQAYAALEKDAVVKILSGNVRTEYDRKYYSGYSLDTVNLTYKYMEGSNPQIVDLDPNCSKLLQGGYNEMNASTMTYGTWDNANPAKILFNMGEECYISGADVWEYYQGSDQSTVSTRAGWVRVSVSDDGKNFTQVSEVYNPKNDADYQVENCIGQDFEAVKCRYVLVTVERGTSHQITLNEVVLKGYRTASNVNAPYSFGSFEYTNELGSKIINLDNNNEVKIKGSVKSNINEEKDVVVISAAYKNNDIVDWGFKSVHISSYGSADFENVLRIDKESGVRVYTFVWDSLEGGLALSQLKEFGTL